MYECTMYIFIIFKILLIPLNMYMHTIHIIMYTAVATYNIHTDIYIYMHTVATFLVALLFTLK